MALQDTMQGIMLRGLVNEALVRILKFIWDVGSNAKLPESNSTRLPFIVHSFL